MSTNWREEYQQKLTTPAEAVKLVESGETVYIGCCSSVAYTLADALADREDELENINVTCSQIIKPTRLLPDRMQNTFRYSSPFMGPQERKMKKYGLLDYNTVHLSQIDIWCKETQRPDTVLLEVSPPDENGFMCLGGTGVGLHIYLKDVAKKVILEVNKNAPYVYGEQNLIHVSEADAIIESDVKQSTIGSLPISPEIQTISDFLLEEIHDGDCFQLGIGGVADAVGYGLKNKNDLGAHTELMTTSMMELMKMGVLNNSRKSFQKGKTVAAFCMGTEELYKYVDHNEDIYFAPFPVVNDPVNIAKNDNMKSVNTALCIDLFGQVCADNIAGDQYSATGGQVDFVRGAQMSKGGKSYIAMEATMTNKKGEMGSKIVSRFPMGTAVTTPRSDVQYIVTEYGCVNLKTLTMKDRVKAMISLAHPDFRQGLTEDARKMGFNI